MRQRRRVSDQRSHREIEHSRREIEQSKTLICQDKADDAVNYEKGSNTDESGKSYNAIMVIIGRQRNEPPKNKDQTEKNGDYRVVTDDKTLHFAHCSSVLFS